jgi:hypothetical protein
VDLRYVLDLVAALPISYKIGLICLAALLYHAIRRSLDRR